VIDAFVVQPKNPKIVIQHVTAIQYSKVLVVRAGTKTQRLLEVYKKKVGHWLLMPLLTNPKTLRLLSNT